LIFRDINSVKAHSFIFFLGQCLGAVQAGGGGKMERKADFQIG
jgi:hypothetical protein